MDSDEKTVPRWKKISLVKWGIPCMVNKAEKTKDGVKEAREKILDKICAPREWWGAGEFWRQHLSAEPVNRLDVMELAEEVDALLSENGIRDTGICDTRQHIYDQLFNEVTRQITLYCVQQGSLLVRIRDELWMMREFYKKMYENNIAFIYRKTVESVERTQELETILSKLKLKKENTEKELKNLQEIIEQKEIIMTTCRQEAGDSHTEIVNKLENIKNTHRKKLQKYLEGVVTVKKQ